MWAKTYPQLKILNNPPEEVLRDLARAEEITTRFGAPSYRTRQAASRSAANTYLANEKTASGRFQRTLDVRRTKEIINYVASQMPGASWISLDRAIGRNPNFSFHCRLLIPQAFARVGLMWSKTLFPTQEAKHDPRVEPDFLTVYFPEALDGMERKDNWPPSTLILINPEQGITFVLGTDYVGEAKMSFLRQALYQTKKKGGLGLHAGSKIVRVRNGQGVKSCGMLLFGLSGTGKTTLTLDDHGLTPPEGVTVLQDDIALLTPQGRAFGTEDNFYVKTEGLKAEEQAGLYQSLINPEAIFENVTVDKSGEIRFTDYTNGTNGRALALRRKIPNTGDSIDLERVDKMIFIARRDTIVPPVARLNRELAAVFFMLGESIETSAGDPTRAGQPKHEVGFNPFIIGPEEIEGNRLYDLLNANPQIEVYLLNTGSVGKGGDAPDAPKEGLKIPKEVSSKILTFLARQKTSGGAGWIRDPDWGYEIPERIPDIPGWENFDPRKYYTNATYGRLVTQLKAERQAWLAQFPGLKSAIRSALPG
ncbi:MAG: phosphoenolpyruvate carboxykinase [Elusimicrobia bacterium]|nr:phosphoenolpyruvate carboxykinase [Elusimicrobiota bacterium]